MQNKENVPEYIKRIISLVKEQLKVNPPPASRLFVEIFTRTAH